MQSFEVFKFNAEVLKYTGFALCTPFSGIIFDQLVSGFRYDSTLILRLVISIILVIIGIRLILRASEIMEKRDGRLEYICAKS